MGQRFKDDKIGTLSHSSGTISMAASSSAPSYLTIGGQQYKLTSNLSRLISSDVTLVANTLYMIYAVVSSGIVVMRVSTNVNSVGPAGFNSWKLVGAFYASGGNSFNGNTVEFGTFVTIEGPPKTLNKFNSGRLTVTAHTSNPTKGNGGVGNTDRMLISIDGKRVTAYMEYAHNVAGSAGTGNYFFQVPFAVDTNVHQANSDSFSGANGQWNAYSDTISNGHISTSNSMGVMAGAQPFDANRIRIWVFNATTTGFAAIGGIGSNFFPFNAVDMEFSFTFSYESSALSAVPLKDR